MAFSPALRAFCETYPALRGHASGMSASAVRGRTQS